MRREAREPPQVRQGREAQSERDGLDAGALVGGEDRAGGEGRDVRVVVFHELEQREEGLCLVVAVGGVRVGFRGVQRGAGDWVAVEREGEAGCVEGQELVQDRLVHVAVWVVVVVFVR